eukprot:COSAG02_NODE_3141_length_7293_cov_3.120795_3_plen_76_part_00
MNDSSGKPSSGCPGSGEKFDLPVHSTWRALKSQEDVEYDQFTGWVGFAWYIENSLRKKVHPVDHLKFQRFIEAQY